MGEESGELKQLVADLWLKAPLIYRHDSPMEGAGCSVRAARDSSNSVLAAPRLAASDRFRRSFRSVMAGTSRLASLDGYHR
jgi:hypothetical protein